MSCFGNYACLQGMGSKKAKMEKANYHKGQISERPGQKGHIYIITDLLSYYEV